VAVRKLYNFLSGTLGAGLTDVATVVDFGGPLPVTLTDTVDGPEYVPLVLSPTTTPEIVHLVSYTEGESTGVVLRGQEGTLAVEHFVNAPWGCKPLVADVEGGGGSVAILAGETPVLSAAEFLRFGSGLEVTQVDFRTARVDAVAQTGLVVEGATVAVALNGEGDLVVTPSSNWGIDQATGEPYYDPNGAEAAEVAVLVFYPATQEYRVELLGTESVSTGSIDQSLPVAQQDLLGTFVQTVFTGSIDHALSVVEQDAVGAVTQPVFSGSIDHALSVVQQDAVGAVTQPVFTGSIGHALSTLQQDAAGTFTQPVFTGSIGQTVPMMQQDAVGTFS